MNSGTMTLGRLDRLPSQTIDQYPFCQFSIRFWKNYWKIGYINILRSITLYILVNLASEHALLLIVDKIQRAIESGQFSCGIFLDLRKAFDTVDHNILLAKLYSNVIRGTLYD